MAPKTKQASKKPPLLKSKSGSPLVVAKSVQAKKVKQKAMPRKAALPKVVEANTVSPKSVPPKSAPMPPPPKKRHRCRPRLPQSWGRPVSRLPSRPAVGKIAAGNFGTQQAKRLLDYNGVSAN